MKKYQIEKAHAICKGYSYKYPPNVEKQIARFWAEKDHKKRKIRMELVYLERIIA